MRGARREGCAVWFGLCREYERLFPLVRDDAALGRARRWELTGSDGGFGVDGEGRCACGLGMVQAAWAAGLCGSCVERRLGLGTAPAGDGRREAGMMRGYSSACTDSRTRALEARKELAFCCRNVNVVFDVLGLSGAMFVFRRGPHKIRLLLVHWHFSGALRCFGHAFVSFRTRRCSLRALRAQACCMRLFMLSKLGG